jgi:23S rRNA (guanosine2251-2'-O)-methyltransferase
LINRTYQIRQCENPNCGLRYPLVESHPFGERCPSCLGATQIVYTRSTNTKPMQSSGGDKCPPLEAFLDNIRSLWNTGSIFRTSDGYGLSHVHLCGVTPTPATSDLSKTALGAEKTVPWTYYKNSVQAGKTLKNEGYLLWAMEQDSRSESIEEINNFAIDLPSQQRIVLIAGNEETGVDLELLDLCDRILFLPMRGNKRSFNVAVAFGIAVHVISMNII